MISPDIIELAKAVPIESYLAYRGYQPVSRSGYRLLYRSPLRGEETPSFWVNQSLNRFKDFGSSERGDDIIRLVQRLNNCSFALAITELQCFINHSPKSDFFLSGPIQSPVSTQAIRSVKLLNNRSLVHYVESRGISYAIARRYCREVYYRQGNKNLFALGFENDKGGFALRNGVGVKRNIGPAYFTTIPGKRKDVVNVFEGFFDFLSALEYFRLTMPNCTSIVLNSTTNLEAALQALKSFSWINTYFDQDETGLKSFSKLKSSDMTVKDRSIIYLGFKDLSEFWQNVKFDY